MYIYICMYIYIYIHTCYHHYAQNKEPKDYCW